MAKTAGQSKKNFFKKNILLIFVIIYTLLSLLVFDPKLFTGGDNAVYMILAQSIASGHGYKNIHLPGEPDHTQYPPGFPLLLSLSILIFGSNLMVFKLLIFLTGLGAMYFMYQISRYVFKEQDYIIMLFYLSVPIFVVYNHWVLSEIPFMFFALGALYFFMKAEKDNRLFYFLSFGCGIYAFFIRTAGISLIIGMMLCLLLKKQYKYFFVFLVMFLIAFVPWQMRNAKFGSEGNYLSQLMQKNPYQPELGNTNFSDIITRIWDNVLFYAFTIFPASLIPILGSSALLTISGIVCSLLAIVGFIKRIRRFSIIELYVIFGIITLLVWPKAWSSDRFLLPILPILIIYIFGGIFWLGEKIKAKYFVFSLTTVLIFLNILGIIPLAKESVTNNLAYLKGNKYAGYSADWPRYFELIEWLKTNIPMDKVVMARKPEFVYLLSHHKSFIYPYTEDLPKMNEAIARSDYLIIDNFYWTSTTRRYLLPIIQKESEKYEIIHQTLRPEFYLIRRKIVPE